MNTFFESDRRQALLGSLAVFVLSSTASAAQHAICYESQMSESMPAAVWGCHEDAAGSCHIRQPDAWSEEIGSTLPGYPPGTYKVYRFASVATYTATIEFFDRNGAPSGTRDCSVSVRGSSGPGAASSGAQLTGFTTDASGMVTTGVWKLVAPTAYRYSKLDLQVPSEFVAVGGGATGAKTPLGALIVESCQSDNCFGYGDWRRWSARTADMSIADATLANPHRTTVYAIGMKVNGLSASQLQSLISVTNQDSHPALAAHPTNQATLLPTPAGNAAPLSGGVRAEASNSAGTLLGQYLTESAPVIELPPPRCLIGCAPRVTGWKVASKDHLVSRPGTLGTWLLALPPRITIGSQTFQVVSKVVSATSGEAAHPVVDVSGMRGEYALTGVGATVDWKRFDTLGTQVAAGNLLWKLEPRPDLGGATVASKDHAISSPARITGHALGIKFVPAP